MESDTSSLDRFKVIDCLTLDVLLAHAFDERELSNRLSMFKDETAQIKTDGTLTEKEIHRAAHWMCHHHQGFGEAIVRTLNLRCTQIKTEISQISDEDLCAYVRSFSVEEGQRAAGLVWALFTDPRDLSSLLSVYLQRLTVHFLYALKNLSIKNNEFEIGTYGKLSERITEK